MWGEEDLRPTNMAKAAPAVSWSTWGWKDAVQNPTVAINPRSALPTIHNLPPKNLQPFLIKTQRRSALQTAPEETWHDGCKPAKPSETHLHLQASNRHFMRFAGWGSAPEGAMGAASLPQSLTQRCSTAGCSQHRQPSPALLSSLPAASSRATLRKRYLGISTRSPSYILPCMTTRARYPRILLAPSADVLGWNIFPCHSPLNLEDLPKQM